MNLLLLAIAVLFTEAASKNDEVGTIHIHEIIAEHGINVGDVLMLGFKDVDTNNTNAYLVCSENTKEKVFLTSISSRIKELAVQIPNREGKFFIKLTKTGKNDKILAKTKNFEVYEYIPYCIKKRESELLLDGKRQKLFDEDRGSVRLLSPNPKNGGVVWVEGEEQTIIWEYKGNSSGDRFDPADINIILLKRVNGVLVDPIAIAQVPKGTVSYKWTPTKEDVSNVDRHIYVGVQGNPQTDFTEGGQFIKQGAIGNAFYIRSKEEKDYLVDGKENPWTRQREQEYMKNIHCCTPEQCKAPKPAPKHPHCEKKQKEGGAAPHGRALAMLVALAAGLLF
ncbi:MAG: uncharacterized protein A8A55_0310 [Amphiamblys sp. WSBS2006]|nr:MAG: uncharacterized protein A8A55_0310 [Amphiamblys sp. WSBS2006]